MARFDPASNPNVTRDGILVKPGQLWADRDHRQAGRVVRVIAVSNGKATMAQRSDLNGTGRTTTVSVRRMYKHSTGFDLID